MVIIPRIDQLPVEAQICHVFGKDCRMALAISQAENGTRACDRVSDTGDVGVFQINAAAHRRQNTIEELKVCLINIRRAKAIYDASGWDPWTVYKTGAYKRFLN